MAVVYDFQLLILFALDGVEQALTGQPVKRSLNPGHGLNDFAKAGAALNDRQINGNREALLGKEKGGAQKQNEQAFFHGGLLDGYWCNFQMNY